VRDAQLCISFFANLENEDLSNISYTIGSNEKHSMLE